MTSTRNIDELHTFDIETNAGDFKDITTFHTVHCLVVRCPDGSERVFDGVNIAEGWQWLCEQAVIGGHNVQGFDIPVMENLYGRSPKGIVLDSSALSQLVWGDSLRWKDALNRKKGALAMPAKLTGLHSLAAWGFRMGEYKDDFMKGRTPQEAFATYTQDMLDYCKQDVVVNAKLFGVIQGRLSLDSRAAVMESELAYHLSMQERHGWRFDEDAAVALYQELATERDALRDELVAQFGSFYLPSGKLKAPKRTLNYKDPVRADFTEGAQYGPVKLTEFNPSSRDHMALVLQRMGWKPSHWTNTGKAQVDEKTLELCYFPVARRFERYLLLAKRIGQIAEGNKAWLKLARNGRIHGRVIANGTRYGRASHANPNITQVPRVGKPWGAQCRACFLPDEGHVLVGGDASGIELRFLAHFAARFDDGALAEVILNGDVHQENTDAIGLNNRDSAKTIIYATLYGAGDEKLGVEVYEDFTEEQREAFGKKTRKAMIKLGRQARAAIMERFPGFEKLGGSVKKAATRGYLNGIDGRRLEGFSQHSALNALLQGSAGVAVKLAYCLLASELTKHGLRLWRDVFVVGFIHDELQVSCRPEDADQVGAAIVEAIRMAGLQFNLSIPLDGEHKSGGSWKETH
jgi:DNA polymerase I-like protein with 3'-5' exonuclease and polymerase domains